MLTVAEAQDRILQEVQVLPAMTLMLSEALPRFSAQSLQASVALPGFDNSAMDGYALKVADSHDRKILQVIGEQAAGVSLPLEVQPGTAIRIFTGAPMPAGAEAVIMQEDVEKLDGGNRILCQEPVELEENIRLTGCDLCVGQRILQVGDKLTPTRLALLASQGQASVLVAGKPRVTILTTGDELKFAGEPLKEGQLYNSNGILLQSLVRELGISETQHHHLPDHLETTTESLRETIATQDVIILAGGISVGDHDYVKQALLNLSIKPEFWRVKVKPGKPVLFSKAQRDDGSACLIFGLPGNPVSAYVTYQLFVRAALLKLMGAGVAAQKLPGVSATITQPLHNKGDRPHYVRGRHHEGQFTALGVQQSHALFGLSQGNALLELAPETSLEAGAMGLVLLVD
jgi:molybdopterin molybdotransferase